MAQWWIFTGTGKQNGAIARLKDTVPPWRQFEHHAQRRGAGYRIDQSDPDMIKAIELVNAALYLRRPLLVTGQPGSGKSTLAYAVAHELGLEPVLTWRITSSSTLEAGLYSYDALARLQEVSLERLRVGEQGAVTLPDPGNFVTLGPVGTALLPASIPRVLLIDEIDKSSFDLPNDLLHVFEEGAFEIPPLVRLAGQQPEATVRTADPAQLANIKQGRVQCTEFPLVIMTSNGERDFPSAFLRRCLRLDLPAPNPQSLARIVQSRLELSPDTSAPAPQPSVDQYAAIERLIADFVRERNELGHTLATDQLLNAAYLVLHDVSLDDSTTLKEALWRSLDEMTAG